MLWIAPASPPELHYLLLHLLGICCHPHLRHGLAGGGHGGTHCGGAGGSLQATRRGGGEAQSEWATGHWVGHWVARAGMQVETGKQPEPGCRPQALTVTDRPTPFSCAWCVCIFCGSQVSSGAADGRKAADRCILVECTCKVCSSSLRRWSTPHAFPPSQLTVICARSRTSCCARMRVPCWLPALAAALISCGPEEKEGWCRMRFLIGNELGVVPAARQGDLHDQGRLCSPGQSSQPWPTLTSFCSSRFSVAISLQRTTG